MLKKHPRGLLVLFFIEMWERFGFYTLMAIFVLYMDKEFGWSDAVKGNYYSIFLGLVYFIPLLGGYIGDRLIGQLRTIRIGAVIMFLGYLALALSSKNQMATFYTGLFLVSFGTGIFKVNISVLVGNLYKDLPELKDAGFNIYYMGVNIGATAAPLAATLISYLYNSYNLSFYASAAGMLISMIILETYKSRIISADTFLAGKQWTGEETSALKPMSYKEESERITALLVLFMIAVFFWVAYYQNGFALTLFAERSTVKLDWLRPETYQFFNPFFILVVTPLLLYIFSRMNKSGKEPSTPFKIFLGMLFMAFSMVVMINASSNGGNSDGNNMSPVWLISTYFLVTLSELLISPMGQSFVSKVAPPRYQGIMMGGWFCATALGSYGSGFMGKYYSDFAHHHFYMLLFGLLCLAAVLVLLALKKLNKYSLEGA